MNKKYIVGKVVENENGEKVLDSVEVKRTTGIIGAGIFTVGVVTIIKKAKPIISKGIAKFHIDTKIEKIKNHFKKDSE